jgi:uncharacterized membrane protein (TIGR02234 family)
VSAAASGSARRDGLGRRFAVVLVVMLVASVAILVSYSATWVVVDVPVFAGTDDSASREIALSGRDLVPLGSAMAWVGLAAIAALLATRTWGRRVTGALVLGAGGVAGVSAVAFAFTEVATGGGGAFVEAALRARTDAIPVVASISPWWIVAIIAGLALMVCGLLALLEGPSWPRLGAKYSRSTVGAAPSAAATWDALDRGEDPTVADGSDPGSMGSADPHSEEDR